MPKVSVVVPVYGVEKYLDRCVQSLRNQTLRDIEIILVDDGSPDNCPAMCDEYARQDSRIRVIHKKNAGLGMARNSGVEVSIGEYITFCDSDDWLDINAYDVIYNHCKENNLDLCCFQYQRVQLDGTITSKSVVLPKKFYGKKAIRHFQLDVIGKDPTKIGSETYGMSSCMAIFRREVFTKSGVRYPSEREVASEDLVFLINLIPHLNRVEIVSDIFYNYLINPVSISQNYSEAKHGRLIKLAETVKDYCESHFKPGEYENHYYTQLLRVFKVIIRFVSTCNESYITKTKQLIEETKHPLLLPFYNSGISRYMSRTDKIYVWAMKKHMGWFFPILYKFKR